MFFIFYFFLLKHTDYVGEDNSKVGKKGYMNTNIYITLLHLLERRKSLESCYFRVLKSGL